jgi:hypothetical protein
MNQIKINQEHLEKMNKDMMKNSNIEMMEKNKIDPKLIESAKLRMEYSDSDSDDTAVIEKEHMKQTVIKKKLNISDQFFHGRPLIKKPPLNAHAFNSYTHVIENLSGKDEVIEKKKKKKKKSKNPGPDIEALMKIIMANNANQGSNQLDPGLLNKLIP